MRSMLGVLMLVIVAGIAWAFGIHLRFHPLHIFRERCGAVFKGPARRDWGGAYFLLSFLSYTNVYILYTLIYYLYGYKYKPKRAQRIFSPFRCGNYALCQRD